MNIKVVDNMFYFTQNLGSSEDIATGALATVFHYCPKFTELLFEKYDISYPNGEDYYVDTGKIYGT